MKLMMKRILLNTKAVMVVALASVMLFSSCRHKELCIEHPHEVKVRVDFDWVDAPDANPEGMCVIFYPEDGGDPQRVDFSGRTGGYVTLIPGKYRLLTYNNDTETVLFTENNSWSNHGVYTSEGDLNDAFNGNATRHFPRAKGSEDQKLILCPEMMWGYSLYEVDVQASGVTYEYKPLYNAPSKPRNEIEEHVIMLFPHELVCTYTYEIRDVEYLSHVVDIAATLSGMSSELKFSDERLNNESSTLLFEGRKYDETTITGKFYTFGHHLDNADPHCMSLYVRMDDGKEWSFTTETSSRFDVTDQVHNAPNPRRVHLIIEGLPIPQPINNGNGFAPNIEPWEEVIEEEIQV